MRTYESIAIGIPEILLPKAGIDFRKWAVIACDQYTSEPEYWQKVSDLVGDAPSTLNLIYPEVYLGEKDPEVRIARIRDNMNRYLNHGLFEQTKGFVYVERQIGGHTRKGLMVCLDLDQYDYRKGSSSLIRATEGTILERIPPRVKIREGAPLEVPHIMVLIDDPENTVIGPLTRNKERIEKLYDFALMMESGHLSGYRVNDPKLEEGILCSLEALADSEAFAKKYDLRPETPVLLFAMGDGNHSLATAKTIWEKTKENASDTNMILNFPLRYALVELVNLHDEALVFEPIHRVLFDLAAGRDAVDEMKTFYPDRCHYSEFSNAEEMKRTIDTQKGSPHKIGVVTASGFGMIEVMNPDSNLPVSTLQSFLDAFLKDEGAKEIDYVHGTEIVIQLSRKPGTMGFYLPAMNKHDLFKTVILDGALPQKTFSLGEAWEKRFYMEARRLS
ncbi:MAG: DUF1015 domain-containing protein [Candidatus Aminicenantes bacterium]|nr:DUF1015 domain-containing protein [Candidatus Aminicenantes bacterium]MDH5384957.1 DUF1015 domain-containing protein [Candidatus Aminicenantes bacterium]